MKALPLIALVALAMVGCGQKEETTITGPDGTQVKMSQDGKDVSVTDEKGNTTNVNTDDKGNVSMSTTGGDVSASLGGVSEGDLGLPFYTGSTESPNMSSKSEVNGKKVVVSTRTTKDDPGKVIAFYKDKVKKPVDSVNDAGGMKVGGLTGELDNGSTVAVAANQQAAGQDTTIVVTVSAK